MKIILDPQVINGRTFTPDAAKGPRALLCLTQTTGYAIKALGALQGPGGTPKRVQALAEESGIPKPYLSKLIHELGESDIIHTRRGQGGGVLLARPPQDVTILQIIEAVEGPMWASRCLLGLEHCGDEQPCAAHPHWKSIRAGIINLFEKTTLAEVARVEQLYRSGNSGTRRSTGKTKTPRKKE